MPRFRGQPNAFGYVMTLTSSSLPVGSMESVEFQRRPFRNVHFAVIVSRKLFEAMRRLTRLLNLGTNREEFAAHFWCRRPPRLRSCTRNSGRTCSVPADLGRGGFVSTVAARRRAGRRQPAGMSSTGWAQRRPPYSVLRPRQGPMRLGPRSPQHPCHLAHHQPDRQYK